MEKKDIFSRKTEIAILIVFIVGLIIFGVFSTRVTFHDTHEYIALAKELAGYGNVSVYSVHPLLYTLIMAQFAKFFPFLTTLKIVNLSWLILIGLLLWVTSKKKMAFLIWAFAPTVWTTTIKISPILIASFLIFCSYLTFKYYTQTKKRQYFVFSSIFMGLAMAFYSPSILFAAIFVAIFLYDSSFKNVILYLIGMGIGYSPLMVLDYFLFGFPLDTTLRYYGLNAMVLLGMHTSIDGLHVLKVPFSIILSIVIISPLLFKLYKLDLKQNIKEILYCAIPFLFFLIRGGVGMYFLLFAPIVVMLLAKVFTKRDLIVHAILSAVVIIFLITSQTAVPRFTYSFFGQQEDVWLVEDFKQIKAEFGFKIIVSDAALALASLSWDPNDPYLIWLEEYILFQEGKKEFARYQVETKPVIDLYKILKITATLEMDNNPKIVKGLPLVLNKATKPLEGYSLSKCYSLLCVYESDLRSG